VRAAARKCLLASASAQISGLAQDWGELSAQVSGKDPRSLTSAHATKDLYLASFTLLS
jgi:hypothetical protein